MHRRQQSPFEATWEAWRLDGELNGHSPAQVIGFVSEMSDLEDAEQAARSRRPNFITTPREPRRIGWFRRRRR